MKLWTERNKTDNIIEDFTARNDKVMDMYLAEYDILGTLAHIKMLEATGLLSGNEYVALKSELDSILERIKNKEFNIEKDVEDIHSQIELELTRKLGDTGKKIHSGRSRNDQVLTAIKLFARDQIKEIVGITEKLFELLINKSEEYKGYLMPGYTHLQCAMPSSFGLWFGAYAESLTDDMMLLHTAYMINNQNPLGSAAGYGSSFNIDRDLTTKLLGFNNMNYNSVYAQMTRGKNENLCCFAIAGLASTLAKMAADICFYNSQELKFITLDDSITTGSSIMPHKKNPDIFELIRARCNRIRSVPNETGMIITNLTSGYFRDVQLLKEILIGVFLDIRECLTVMIKGIEGISIRKNILDNKVYDQIFSVEEINNQVMNGVPFREAYKNVSELIISGKFIREKKLCHKHVGSINNLCNEKIIQKMKRILNKF